MGKKAVKATDYGRCFADANNVYLHDGVSARPIGDPILRNTLHKEWRVGYINSMQIAANNNHDVNVLYDAENRAFMVCTQGFCGASGCSVGQQRGGARAFSYSLSKKRWDYVEIPQVKGYAKGMKNKSFLTDGSNIWENKTLYSEKRDWEWHSKNMTFGRDTQLKVFKKLKLTGSPSSVTEGINANIKTYVDGVEKALTAESKNYTSTKSTVSLTLADTDADTTVTYEAIDSDKTYSPSIMKGMYLKIDDEIVLVESSTLSGQVVTLVLKREQLNTVKAAHTTAPVYILGPSFKFPSGTKGYKMRFELSGQTGLLDSVGIIYRGKGVK